jgi:ABC-2 type transport system permease protein
MPFNVANKFHFGTGWVQRWQGRRRHMLSNSPLSQGWATAYFAGFALVMLAIAIGMATKRDARSG